ncbi:MAG: beta-glucosidase, partial [Bacteroidales bacterium]|nr:beta-glucosidase [Bacteroidales bacterium]
MKLSKTQFGDDFQWGVSTAAFQTEGAFQDDGKGLSIWDIFSTSPGNIADGSNARVAVDFYHRYQEDLQLINQMHFNNFRFSLSWPRILPEGIGRVNQKGIDYYHRLIDSCLERQIEPWITLYHWDLPQVLEDKGGWTNREIINCFLEYVDVCTKNFGDRVKNWIVLNEPMSFVGLGYFMGIHAPGRKGMRNFLRAAHHAALCQAEGGRVIRANIPDAYIGTTFSCSHIKPVDKKEKNVNAALRMDALLNRFFIEPSLGMGYPTDTLGFLKNIEKHFLPGDEERLKFDFDFIGLQYYFRTITKFSLFPPLLFANEVPANERQANMNTMGFEIFPKGLYKMIKKFSRYPGVKDIIITESGVCLDDNLENLRVADAERIAYFKDSLSYILKARQKGMPVKGFFAWTLMDNFEWAEGYKPRFG